MSPDPKAKVYLQTPNWPYGLPPYVSISWYILVPSKQVARLGFSKDRMGIVCETGRAYVNIKEETPGAEETVCREDELLPQPRNMYHNFWVNVSNCKPVERTQLTLQFQVTSADKQIGESSEAVVVRFLLVSWLSLGEGDGCRSSVGVGFMRALPLDTPVLPKPELQLGACRSWGGRKSFVFLSVGFGVGFGLVFRSWGIAGLGGVRLDLILFNLAFLIGDHSQNV